MYTQVQIFTAWAIALSSLCASEIPVNVPFQIVRPTPNHTSLMITDALPRLALHDTNIAVVSVVGPYHSGKSFLLNALVGNTQVFQIGRKTSPETMGIWLCRTDLKASDGAEVWLMDSEGFFGPGVSESYDAKIFTIASLLGGHLVYNTVKVIDQQAVNLLEMLVRRAQLFRTRSSADIVSQETPEFLSIRSFPPLTWVVEDFVQELPVQHRHEDGATHWLKAYLTKMNTTHGESHFLTKLYTDLKVHTLFLPATTKEHLQDLSRMKWNQLTPEFRSEISALRDHVLRKLEARTFEGKSVTGRTLERAVRFMVQALHRGMFHELPALWATWSAQVSDMSLQDAETWFNALVANVDSAEDPLPVAQFNMQVEEIRQKVVQFYRDLLRDFEVNPDVSTLRKKMDAHFQHKVMLYHERVQRWVSELTLNAKDALAKQLATIELPTDPDELKKASDKLNQNTTQIFVKRLNAFAVKGITPRLGKAVLMPAFTQDPVNTLTADLRSIQSSRELENEREILQFFKRAVQAADDAVDREVKSYSKLLGKARLREFQSLVSNRCWQAFDESLVNYKWLITSQHYRTHKALVQTETYESRMARFAHENDARLSQHFRKVQEQCENIYKKRRENIVMPTSEADLAAEHKAIGVALYEVLKENSADLEDTEAFAGSKYALNSLIEEGAQRLQLKNVELWKVHSDEATRCAQRENHALERKCGLTCMFNKLPNVHKKISKKHLLGCLGRSGTASRMEPKMQLQVFENWYSKDLAADAAAVWNNCYLGTAIIGLLFILLFWTCRATQPAQPFQTGMGQMTIPPQNMATGRPTFWDAKPF